MTQALILAAGLGSRLRPLTDDRPQALVPIGDVPLIGHALDSLLEAGIKDAVVVTGHGRGALETYLASRRDFSIVTVENRGYRTSNTLASFAAAAHLIDDDFFLIDGDLVFEPAVVSRLMGPGTRLAVDPSRPLDDEAMKVSAEGERVIAISKQLSMGESMGESIGMAKIDIATGERLFVIARHLLDAGACDLYYESAFEALIIEGDVFEMADVTGLKWVEVDDHDDLRRAGGFLVPR
jgi:choline kinase